MQLWRDRGRRCLYLKYHSSCWWSDRFVVWKSRGCAVSSSSTRNFSASFSTVALRYNLRQLLHPFNGPLSGTTRVGRYQKGKTNRDFTEARDSEWQWHQLGHMQVCTSLQTDNHASTPPLSFLQAGCPSCLPTNSVKELKARATFGKVDYITLPHR